MNFRKYCRKNIFWCRNQYEIIFIALQWMFFRINIERPFLSADLHWLWLRWNRYKWGRALITWHPFHILTFAHSSAAAITYYCGWRLVFLIRTFVNFLQKSITKLKPSCYPLKIVNHVHSYSVELSGYCKVLWLDCVTPCMLKLTVDHWVKWWKINFCFRITTFWLPTFSPLIHVVPKLPTNWLWKFWRE